MKLAKLIEGEGRVLQGPANREIAGLTADSRTVKPGYMFAALSGTKIDGREFIADALTRGAVAVLLEGTPVGPVPENITVVGAGQGRHALAVLAARLYAPQPEVICAVTGTNGKTSVASFLTQIWEGADLAAASIGTLGVVTAENTAPLALTTPGPVKLHMILQRLTRDGITHVALEASSHGLAQRRLDGVRLRAAGFTNITRDHLDYHGRFEDYLAEKGRLFFEVLPPDTTAVIYLGSVHAEDMAARARAAGLEVITVGPQHADLALVQNDRAPNGQMLTISYDGQTHHVHLPLAGAFQVENALVAAGLAVACGGKAADAFAGLEGLKGARGRLEFAGATASGAHIYIDYAHTPDALAMALGALRPHTSRSLAIVFGCGGDRDRGKRPQMGEIAARNADLIIVTDDNPRTEDAAKIRAEILQSCPGAAEIASRGQAIASAIEAARSGDVILIAGKGHETGQIIGDVIVPFSDHDVVAELLEKGM